MKTLENLSVLAREQKTKNKRQRQDKTNADNPRNKKLLANVIGIQKHKPNTQKNRQRQILSSHFIINTYCRRLNLWLKNTHH
jgi:hypothetical protein